jgi:fibronectin type 3 domain-containing protein
VISSAYTDSTVSNGTTYYYVVTAEDSAGNESGYSNQASATPQAPDTVTIVTATYTTRNSTLYLEATSSQQPAAVLTVVGFGQMTWKNNKQLYTLSKKPVSNPGTVTVTSSLGGSDTKTVTVK